MNRYFLIFVATFQFILLQNVATFQSRATPSESVFTVTYSNNPSPGYLIMGALENPYLAIYDNCANIVFKKSFGGLSEGFADFKFHPNGKFSAFDFQIGKFIILDSNFTILDTVGAVGYRTDWHDFLILPNGNYLVIGETSQIIDMSRLVPGGHRSAFVYSFILQEINWVSKEVVWSWNALDHYSILDATEDVILTSNSLDPFHINSVALASDGNLVISCRHLDELTKINRSTGEIMWRMGGSKCRNNQFEFVGDTSNNFFGFSHQHDPKFLSNGNLLLFDNGSLKPVQSSRAVEYEIDEANRRVRKVWEYIHPGNEENPSGLFVPAMGSVQRLPNGNTLIGWGGSQGAPGNVLVLTEVRSNGSLALEIQANLGSYRVQRIIFKSFPVELSVSTTGLHTFSNSQYNTNLSLYVTNVNGSGKILVEKHQTEPSNITFTGPCTRLPYRWTISKSGITSLNGQIWISLNGLSGFSDPQKLKIFFRPDACSGNFTELTTTYNSQLYQLEANFAGYGEYCIGMNSTGIPTLLYPSSTSINQQFPLQLTWRRYMPNEVYNLQIAKDKNFSDVIYENSEIRDTFIVLQKLDYMTTYYWRVRAKSDQCISDWSEIRSFTTVLEPIKLSYPENFSINKPLRIRFSWEANSQAQIYQFQLSEDLEFSNPIIDTLVITAYFDVSNLEYYKNYYWRSRIWNGIYVGEFSPIWTFRTIYAPPKLISPANFATSLPISGEIKWNSSAGAERYNLIISKKADFVPPVIEVADLTSTFYIYESLDYFTEYYWKVKAIGADGKSDWSEKWKFRTQLPPPTLVSPKDGYSFAPTKGLLQWNNVQNAIGYQQQISTDPNFQVNIFTHQVNYTYFIYSDFIYETYYYWRVRAFEENGYSPWSEIFTFRTIPEDFLAEPFLVYPPDQTKNVKKGEFLTWLRIPNAKSYLVQIATDHMFINIVQSQEVTDTLLLIKNLSNGTRYYWRVRAQNETRTSNWSEIFCFITAIREPLLLSPLDKAKNLALPIEFIWERTGPNLFSKFQIAYDPNFNFIISERDLYDQNSISYSNLPLETILYWRVKVYNSSLESDCSSVSSLSISVVNHTSSSESLFEVYPNPFSEFIFINWGEKDIRNCTITLYDTFERVVFEEKLNYGNGIIRLRPENLNPGTYIIKVSTGKDYFLKKLIFLP